MIAPGRAALAVGAALVVVLLPGAAQTPGFRRVQDTPDRVRIRHEFVHVRVAVAEVATPAPPASGGVAPATRPVGMAAGASRASRASARRGMFSRAARALAGDGRYRPEPFPRPAAK